MFNMLVLLPGCGNEEGIRIGVIAPLSENSAKYGIWMKEALEMRVDEVNSEGGVDGSQVKLIFEDDQTVPLRAASAMQKLVDADKVLAVFGSWASSCVLAQAPIAENSKTILMAQGISPQIRYAGDYVFRCIPDANHSLSTLVPFAFDRGTRKAATIYVNNDYGRDQARAFKEKLTVLGGEVVFEEGYESDAADFRTVLAKMKGREFDAVYLPGYTEVGLILRQMKELEIDVQVYSSDPFENEDVIKAAGDAAEGVYYPSFFSAEISTGEALAFVKAYRERYGRDPEGTAALVLTCRNGCPVLSALSL